MPRPAAPSPRRLRPLRRSRPPAGPRPRRPPPLKSLGSGGLFRYENIRSIIELSAEPINPAGRSNGLTTEPPEAPVASYAELHCHTHFSFLDGASPPDELVGRAVELGLAGLAVTDHGGLYGVVRFAAAAQEAGLRPVVGVEIELMDAAVPDPAGVVVPPRRPRRRAPAVGAPLHGEGPRGDGLPARPCPDRTRLPGHRAAVKEDLRGVGEGQRGPHLVLLARNAAGYRSLCRLVSRANLAGTKSMPRFSQELLAAHTDGLVALSGCREGEIARRLRVGDRAGARAATERYARLFGGDLRGAETRGAAAHGRHGHGDSPATAGFFLELQHHLLPDDDWLVAETALLAEEMGLPVVVTNDVHYAYPEGRELQDVLTAIRHGRTLDELRDLRRPDGEAFLKAAGELMALPPGNSGADVRTAAAWVEGIGNSGELAANCSVDLGFERYRFPGFPVPGSHTPFSYLEELCHEGARRRYHPISSPVVRQLAHELDVIERTGLAEFFLICWDLMRFARSRGIPAQGRGSAADSIVAYVLGITRVDPIRHNLLFERFINEGRTSYPDVDIDFSSERREEVIQYVYRRYGPEHTGMVCNLVTYRARSAVREVGYALGFPRPLVDRVAKALETYDSVMVRRDLEAEGGFGQFFAQTVEREAVGAGLGAGAEEVGAGLGAGAEEVGAAMAVGVEAAGAAMAAEIAGGRGLIDRMGQLNHPHGGRIASRVLVSGVAGATARDASPFLPNTHRVSAMEPGGPDRAAEVRLDDAVLPNTHRGSAVGPYDRVSGPGDGAEMVNRTDLRSKGQVTELSAGHAPTYYSLHAYSAGERGDAGGGSAARGAGHGATRVADLGGGSAMEQQRRLARRRTAGSDTEGGPGDSPASIAWLAAERAAKGPARALEAGMARGAAGRPAATGGAGGPGGPDVTGIVRPEPHSSVARVQPQPQMPPDVRRGSTIGMPDWERWLAFCARIDGFPRHLSIHTGGMLVTAAPLIDIAPLERATMPDRVVVQFDKRDVETIKLIKLDLLGLGMLAAIDETLQLIEADCAVCVDLDRLPEDVPEVFEMLQAADTVGVFQVESRAQMQTLPKSRPANLDDLVVEVAIIRPGPIQGNAVHPYLRRRQGLEPVVYLHPSLEPVLRETLGVILYQEQVMQIAITVAGFSAGESDGFRRAMGTWRSSREMEKLHARFVDGCRTTNGLTDEQAEELFRQVAAFASFGFAKSHAAAFARTAYESAFLKLFYPAQFTAGLINAQPMGFYPVEVLINDAKRHGVAVLPADVNASSYRTATEWVGRDGEPLPEGAGIARRPAAVRSSGCVVPSAASRSRWTPELATGYGIRLGLALVKGIGDEHAERLDAELARGPYHSLADVVARTELPEEVIERLIRAGALDSLGRPRRELLWQLREVMGATRGRVDGRTARRKGGAAGPADGRTTGVAGRPAGSASSRTGAAAGRPMDLRLPPTPAPELPALTERERVGDSYAVLSLDARRQVVSLFRPALERLGAVTNASLADRGPGPVRLGGLVVTRQHPMTARGTVFLALEDETGMVNITLWPDAWARLRGVVRRHALLYVEGMLQREANVVNVVAREVRSLPAEAERVGGPERPEGVRALGYSGMRRG
jgi:DNA polymerase III alpha subunit